MRVGELGAGFVDDTLDAARRRTGPPRLLITLVVGLVGLGRARIGAATESMASDVPRRGVPAGLDGGINLYRDGVFTTQKSWLWCTAAGHPVVRNIVRDQGTTARAHSASTSPGCGSASVHAAFSAGVDPQGWTAGFRQYIDDRYRLVSSTTFDNALRSADGRLRQTSCRSRSRWRTATTAGS